MLLPTPAELDALLGRHGLTSVLRFGRRLVYGTALCEADGRPLTHHTMTCVRPGRQAAGEQYH